MPWSYSKAFAVGEAGGRIPLSRIFDRQHGACGVLDCGFPGVCLIIHPDPNPFCGRGFNSIIFHQTTKEGHTDPLCCLVKPVGIASSLLLAITAIQIRNFQILTNFSEDSGS